MEVSNGCSPKSVSYESHCQEVIEDALRGIFLVNKKETYVTTN